MKLLRSTSPRRPTPSARTARSGSLVCNAVSPLRSAVPPRSTHRPSPVDCRQSTNSGPSGQVRIRWPFDAAGRTTLNQTEDNDRVLVVAMPLRHLEAASAVCEQTGSATLPAGGPGDLDDARPGATVLVIATEAGDAEVPAATWRGVLEGRVPHQHGDPWPDGLPGTWLEEHARSEAGSASREERGGVLDDDEEEEDDEMDDEDVVGPQTFFRVRELAPSPRDRWVHVNELVPKQQRGGRTFFPRTPRLVTLVD